MVEIDLLEKIPIWNEFAVLTEVTGDRIPVVRVNDWRQFTEILDEPYFNKKNVHLVFRGHRRFDWGLTPSLGRLSDKGIVTQKIAKKQLDYFRRAVRGRVSDSSIVADGEEEELWSVGQHHGLSTPLLDWTYSPYVALFFAFEKDDSTEEKQQNPYRVIYVLDKSYVEKNENCPQIKILEPRKDNHGRLVNQAGLFTLSDYENTLENYLIDSLEEEVLENLTDEDEVTELSKYICKIYIPNKNRDECLRHLRRMNVHHASLFPDILGASEYCNILIAESIAEEENAPETDGSAEEENAPETDGSAEEENAPETDGSAEEENAPETDGSAEEEDVLERLKDLIADATESQQLEEKDIFAIADKILIIFEIKTKKSIDWKTREPVKASMRTAFRSIMREYVSSDEGLTEITNKILSYFTELNQEGTIVDR
nr:FRG domain-containing protein [uncultured Methanolobus sp.]